MTNAEKVVITTEFIKLDSFLKFAGLTDTGGQAKRTGVGRQSKGKRRSMYHARQKNPSGRYGRSAESLL